jgi:hypothetical protein
MYGFPSPPEAVQVLLIRPALELGDHGMELVMPVNLDGYDSIATKYSHF